MIYVQRDEFGNIKGLYANPQPQPDGSCLTEENPLPEDHPEVIAYKQLLDASQKMPTLADVISVLSADQKAVLEKNYIGQQ